jgi:hypothetical protein
MRRPAEDFTAEVLQAYREIVERAKTLHGAPRLEHGPNWMDTDQGMARRISTVWFIPRNTGFRVEERGRPQIGGAPAVPRSWEVAAWNHAGPITGAEVSFRRPPTAEDIADVARRVGLLPRLVEVTPLGSTSPQFLDGIVDMDRCPRCQSPAPNLHPAMQHEGEVQPCSHPFHKP